MQREEGSGDGRGGKEEEKRGEGEDWGGEGEENRLGEEEEGGGEGGEDGDITGRDT